jgi:molecular chaperone DnaK
VRRYALGIDVGTRTVTAAVCRIEADDRPGEARPLDGDDIGLDGLLGGLPIQQALTRVGDPIPLYGGPEPRSAAQVLADLVVRVQRGAESADGAAPARTVLAVPPSWGEHRRAELAAALTAAVGVECTLASSAVAAARHHRAVSGSTGAGTVAVYDLGAGTVDIAVIRATVDGTLEHAAAPPAPCPWGGRDVDDAVLQHVRAAVGLPDVPTTPGERVRATALRNACVTAKERLSTEPAVRVEVDLPTSRESVRLVRADLDELIAGSIAESVTVVRTAVTDAGLTPGDLDGIVLAGGGVLVPLVASTLSAELDVPLLVHARPALTVACGAAALAADLIAADDAADDLPDDDTGNHTDDWDDTVVVGLGARRSPASQRGTVRLGVVAALLIALLVTPLSLMGLLDGAVNTRSVQGVAVAEEPTVPAPAPVPDPAVSPAGGPQTAPGARSTTNRNVGTTSRAPRATSSPPVAAGPTVAAPTQPAAAATTAPTTAPPVVPTVDPAPPVTETPPPTTETPPPTTETPPPTTEPAPETVTPESQTVPTDAGGGGA